MKSFSKYWFPVILWAGLIFTLSAIPNLKSDLPSGWDIFFRKCAHMTEYAIFALLLTRAFVQQDRARFWDLIAVFFVAGLYAISDEIHQASVLGRHGSIWDVGIDTVGILAGLAVYYFFRKKYHRTEVQKN